MLKVLPLSRSTINDVTKMDIKKTCCWVVKWPFAECQFVLGIFVFNTWFKCLGLKNKKDLVKDIIWANDLDVILLQETEIGSNVDSELLRIPGYILELEDNVRTKRVGIYLKNNLNYKRQKTLT